MKIIKKLIRRVFNIIYSPLNRFGIVMNSKQRGWLAAMKRIPRGELVILETGRIRNPKWNLSDGNSTYFFSSLRNVKQIISIDNDSENHSGYSSSEEYCKSYLNTNQLKKVKFLNGDSRILIKKLPHDTVVDILLLDSANEPELILAELKSGIQYLTRRPALVIIDDVSNGGKKGELAIPYLENLTGGHFKIIDAPPYNCAYIILD
jgi:hypothetical protein